MPINDVKGYRVSLEEGQSWDDDIVLTMKRMHGAVIMTALSGGLRDMTDTLKEVKKSADEGDIIATLLYGPMLDTARDMQDTLREVVKVMHPDLYAEIMAEATEATETGADAKDEDVQHG